MESKWKIIEKIGWWKITYDTELIKKNLLSLKYCKKSELDKLYSFVNEKKDFLYNKYKSKIIFLNLWDDWVDDLLYQIIGEWEESFNLALNDFNYIKEKADNNDYHESFIYCFLF